MTDAGKHCAIHDQLTAKSIQNMIYWYSEELRSIHQGEATAIDIFSTSQITNMRRDNVLRYIQTGHGSRNLIPTDDTLATLDEIEKDKERDKKNTKP